PQFRPQPPGAGGVNVEGPIGPGSVPAMLMMIELVFGFFATAGAMGADWGAVSRTERDVRLGGWVSVAMASWTVATLALLTVAGSLAGQGVVPGAAAAAAAPPLHGRGHAPGPVGVPQPAPEAEAAPLDYTFRGVALHTIGGTLGTAILLVF